MENEKTIDQIVTMLESLMKKTVRKKTIPHLGILLCENNKVVKVDMSARDMAEKIYTTSILIPSMMIEHNPYAFIMCSEGWQTNNFNLDAEKEKLYSEGVLTPTIDPDRKEIAFISIETPEYSKQIFWNIKRYKKEAYLVEKMVLMPERCEGMYTQFFNRLNKAG